MLPIKKKLKLLELLFHNLYKKSNVYNSDWLIIFKDLSEMTQSAKSSTWQTIGIHSTASSRELRLEKVEPGVRAECECQTQFVLCKIAVKAANWIRRVLK